MRIPWKVLGAVAGAIVFDLVCSYIVDALLRRKAKKLRETLRRIPSITWFGSIERAPCQQHILDRTPCDDCSMHIIGKIVQIMDNAKVSIDICLQQLTIEDVTLATLEAQDRGVRVRVISDWKFAEGHYSQIKYLQMEDVPVVLKRSHACMHQKFIVVDNSILIFGSMNWTLAGFCGNWEHLTIFFEEPLAARFTDYFDELWRSNYKVRTNHDESGRPCENNGLRELNKV